MSADIDRSIRASRMQMRGRVAISLSGRGAALEIALGDKHLLSAAIRCLASEKAIASDCARLNA